MTSFVLLSLVAASALQSIAFARPSFRVPMPPFSNFTRFHNVTHNVTDVFEGNVKCIPFEDPHCCVDVPVCECRNGTFFSTNPKQLNGTDLFCVPPGNVTFGQDTSSIPGWCC
ncbi:hypothetical protein F4804DRAFT_332033 [Jackrogersella minutella]|nr:hypothetical protein F4804DRAFT_332033 [Jackrogersella minutella]